MKTCTIMFWFRRKYSFVKLEIENGFNLGVMLGSWVTEVLVNSYITSPCNYKVQLSTWSCNVLLVVSTCVIQETTAGRSKHKWMHVAITFANNPPSTKLFKSTGQLLHNSEVLSGLGKNGPTLDNIVRMSTPPPNLCSCLKFDKAVQGLYGLCWPQYCWMSTITFDNYIEFDI